MHRLVAAEWKHKDVNSEQVVICLAYVHIHTGRKQPGGCVSSKTDDRFILSICSNLTTYFHLN